MSAGINDEPNKALLISTGPADLESAVIAGMRLLRGVRLCSPLGIAGLMLSLAMTRNFRLFHVVLGAADRIVNRSHSKRQEGV